MVILKNSVKCLKCNVEVVSAHRHDFVWCACRNIAVDGGNAYLKRCGAAYADGSYEDTSIILEEEDT